MGKSKYIVYLRKKRFTYRLQTSSEKNTWLKRRKLNIIKIEPILASVVLVLVNLVN